jgi:hypothetical protein
MKTTAAPAPDAIPADTIPDDLILAAIERSERHRVRRGAPRWEIYDHLDIRKNSREARHVRGQVAALAETGLLEASRAHNIPMWVLTKKGRRHLRRAGDVEALLPESPQHRTWARARTLGEQEIDRFCGSLRQVLSEALETLSAPAQSVSSDTWYELGQRLDCHARRLGSVIHCLHEWAEPSDDAPDIDGHRNRSRRSFCFWGWADEMGREHASNGRG